MLWTLVFLATAGHDIAVVDVGGLARVADVRAAVARVDPAANIIADVDAHALVDDYARGCNVDDGVCWARAAVASAVTLLVLVPADSRLVFVDVTDAQARAVDAADVDAAVERGLFPGRFGRIVVAGAPAGAVVVIDGRPLPADQVVRAGPHRVHIEAAGFVARDLELVVTGAADAAVDGHLAGIVARPDLLWIWPAASAVVGAAALVVGAGIDLHLGSEQDKARDGVDVDVDSYQRLEGVEVGSLVVAALAAASGIVGAAVVWSAPDELTAP